MRVDLVATIDDRLKEIAGLRNLAEQKDDEIADLRRKFYDISSEHEKCDSFRKRAELDLLREEENYTALEIECEKMRLYIQTLTGKTYDMKVIRSFEHSSASQQ